MAWIFISPLSLKIPCHIFNTRRFGNWYFFRLQMGITDCRMTSKHRTLGLKWRHACFILTVRLGSDLSTNLSYSSFHRYWRNVPSQFLIASFNIFSQFGDKSVDWPIKGSNPGWRHEFISSSERLGGVWGPTQPLIHCASGVFPGG